MRRLTQFLENRLGLTSFWRNSMSEKRPPKGIGILRTFGFAALTVLLLQFLTGIALSLHYVPSADLAYDSIRALEQDIPLGRFARSLHHFGASAFVILVVLHMLRVFFTGAYKAPRELTWMTGVGLFVLVLAFGFTGYLLPWDQKAYFATKVGTEIAGKAPWVGPMLQESLNGGDSVGPPTLTRFYIIHVVILPIALLGLVGLHLFLIQRHGVAAPKRPVGDEGEPGPPYFPGHVFKEALVGIVVAGILVALAAQYNAPLEFVAEPSDTGYDPKPDWYFYGLFELLKLFKGPLEPVGAFWLPNFFLVVLVLLPFLDRSPHRDWRRRPITISLGILALLTISGLTISGWLDKPENEPTLQYPLGLTSAERSGYLLVRRLRCLDCHAIEQDGITIGGSKDHPDAPYLDELDEDPDELAEFLENPADRNEDTEMPDYAHIPYEERRAIGLYLLWLIESR